MEVRRLQFLQHVTHSPYSYPAGGYEYGSSTLYNPIYTSIIFSWENNETRRYDGTVIVNRSITLQQPVIYVSMNYR